MESQLYSEQWCCPLAVLSLVTKILSVWMHHDSVGVASHQNPNGRQSHSLKCQLIWIIQCSLSTQDFTDLLDSITWEGSTDTFKIKACFHCTRLLLQFHHLQLYSALLYVSQKNSIRIFNHTRTQYSTKQTQMDPSTKPLTKANWSMERIALNPHALACM
jgi:hypothetical protein